MPGLYRHVRDWYAKQARPAPGGAFHVRPYRNGPVFALADAAARDRYAARRALFHFVEPPVVLAAALVFGALYRDSRPVALAVLLPLGLLPAVQHRVSLRGATRLPPGQPWPGPWLRDRYGVHPRWLWWTWFALSLLLGLVSTAALVWPLVALPNIGPLRLLLAAVPSLLLAGLASLSYRALFAEGS